MARRKAPGKWFREGVSIVQVMEMFPDDATAEAGFAKRRWPNGVKRPDCAQGQVGATHGASQGRLSIPSTPEEVAFANALDAKVADLLY